MRSISHPASFVSALPLTADWAVSTQEGSSSAAVREIYAAVARGQDAQRRRQYDRAIAEYGSARVAALRLLRPQLPNFLDYISVLPAGDALERQLATVSLNLIQSIREQTPVPDVAAAVADVELPPEIADLPQTGYITHGMATSAAQRLADGAELLRSGRGADSVAVLLGVLDDLGDDDLALRATTTLNLASAQLVAGDPGTALRSAEAAAKLFEKVADDVGRAQAHHTRAVALSQLDKTSEAKAALAAAVDTLTAVTAEWEPSLSLRSDGPGPGGPALTPGSPTRDVGVPELTAPGLHASDLSTHHLPDWAGGHRIVDSPAMLPRQGTVDDIAMSSVGAQLLERPVVRPRLAGLDFIADGNLSAVTVRFPGADGGWSSTALPNPAERAASAETWSFELPAAGTVTSVVWQDGVAPTAEALLDTVYVRRQTVQAVSDLWCRPTGAGEAAAYLTHLYAYVLPSSLADCHHALGRYDRAHQHYLLASGYSYLNALEAESVWIRLAENVLAWGDDLYREERLDEAKDVYARLVTADGGPALTEPAFSLAPLAAPADSAKTVLADPSQASTVNPQLARSLLVILARWAYLNAGLDFWGTSLFPIFTFDYLQQVASGFAQQSIQAEREYVNFQNQAEGEAATRRELQGAAALADAEVAIRGEQLAAAAADTAAMGAAADLAALRAQHAQEDRDGYADAGYWQYVGQSIATATGAGKDWYGSEIRGLAADIERGSAQGEGAQLAAAATLLGGQKSYEYQLDRLGRGIEEMNAAIPIAQAQLASAQARERAAALGVQAAELRADLTRDALTAFENEVFTPELWTRMASIMRGISADYQFWAIRTAKLMERAYNFETDASVSVIRSSYPVGGTDGLLGSDYLLRDVSSFTYSFVTQRGGKTTNLKEVVSLANDYPFAFYEFQRTGRITLDTSLRDFDHRAPGFHSQRISAVEVEMIALAPPGGIRGYLRGGNISRYRSADGSDRMRFHQSDTMALSDYTTRGDGLLFRADPRLHGTFEGHGLASTWELELPRRSNNLDFRTISDVRLVFYYSAQFSPGLRDAVLAAPALPGELVHVRTLLPRWDFPEAWYPFLDSGTLTLPVTPQFLPRNEQDFSTAQVTVQVLTTGDVSAADVDVVLTLPGRPPATVTTDSDGAAATEPGNAFQAAMGSDVLGEWTIQLVPRPGSALRSEAGGLNGDLVEQVVVILQYGFTWAG
ncbi:MAG: hypothetical protein ACRC35_01260 [Angustibacter sp.]